MSEHERIALLMRLLREAVELQSVGLATQALSVYKAVTRAEEKLKRLADSLPYRYYDSEITVVK